MTYTLLVLPSHVKQFGIERLTAMANDLADGLVEVVVQECTDIYNLPKIVAVFEDDMVSYQEDPSINNKKARRLRNSNRPF